LSSAERLFPLDRLDGVEVYTLWVGVVPKRVLEAARDWARRLAGALRKRPIVVWQPSPARLIPLWMAPPPGQCKATVYRYPNVGSYSVGSPSPYGSLLFRQPPARPGGHC